MSEKKINNIIKLQDIVSDIFQYTPILTKQEKDNLDLKHYPAVCRCHKFPIQGSINNPDTTIDLIKTKNSGTFRGLQHFLQPEKLQHG